MCTLSGFVDNGAMVGFMWTLTLLSIDRLADFKSEKKVKNKIL